VVVQSVADLLALLPDEIGWWILIRNEVTPSELVAKVKRCEAQLRL
jgi:hypothetical protein